MKIVILGLITVVFTNVAMASPSDKGGNDDMILEQIKDLRHKLQQQQHVIKELKEEQQKQKEDQQQQKEDQQHLISELKEEQVRRDEDQQYKMEELKEKQERRIAEQERRVEEVRKIQRARRSEKETVEHLKKLVNARRSDDEIVEELKKFVHAEIKPMIDGLSECAVGRRTYESGAASYEFDETQTVTFGRNFTRTPKVIAALAGYHREGNEQGGWFNVGAQVVLPTTTKFGLRVYADRMKLKIAYATWVACA